VYTFIFYLKFINFLKFFFFFFFFFFSNVFLGQGDVGAVVLNMQIKSYMISRPKPEMICNISPSSRKIILWHFKSSFIFF